MLVAVYGTLRKGQGNYFNLQMDQFAEFIGTDHIRGTMFSLGGFPGILMGDNHRGDVVVDVFFLPEEHRDMMLRRLDALEGYDPEAKNPSSNMYMRKVTTTYTGRMVFVYEWNWEPPEDRIIPDGDWVEYQKIRPRINVKAI